MDQIRIGKFIADERKRKGYTQKQLSEKLEISDKTISKWERGNGFPEVSLLLPLCNELEITVNELLSGERVSEEDYRKKAEENMVNLVREAQESKKKIILSAVVAALTIIAAVPLFMVSGMIEMENGIRISLILLESRFLPGVWIPGTGIIWMQTWIISPLWRGICLMEVSF